jgi:hypothetical protein
MDDSRFLPLSSPFVTWADETFNPWLDSVRTLSGSLPLGHHIQHPALEGDPQRALCWQSQASAFASAHRRRRRVLVGPWCQPFCGQNLNARGFSAFWPLVRHCDSLDWLAIVDLSEGSSVRLPEDWGVGYQNVWVGSFLRSTPGAPRTLARLRGFPAARRFVLVSAVQQDLGDIDLTGVDWVVVVGPPPTTSEQVDALTSVRLQAMGHCVPIWFDQPVTNSRDLHRHEAFSERHEPR